MSKPTRRRATIDAAIMIIGIQLIPFLAGTPVSVTLAAAPPSRSGQYVSGFFCPSD